ncbi:MAG: hypothetical protein LWW95_08200 [Candidatus Desulfofervidus auxilii]|nr:hypothetical protein [Candidatus Desulfofervidus auxilii]
MKKFSAIFQKKDNITNVEIECSKGSLHLFLYELYDIYLRTRSLSIIKSYKTFPLRKVVVYRKRVPFYHGEVILGIAEAPTFCWIFVFALSALKK